MPTAGGWPVSGSVRDDTVSTDGPVPVTVLPGAFLVLMVSFPLMPLIGGCAAARGLAACNTNCPWRRGRRGEIVLP